MEFLWEAVLVILSSGGIAGTAVAAVLSHVLKNARADADKRREERLEGDMLRMECDECSAEMLLTISRFCRGECGERELSQAEDRYVAALEKQNAYHKKLLCEGRNDKA